jgi:hypothetical protein
LYKKGFPYQLTAEEIRNNEERNEQFQQNSTEYEYIQLYLRPGNVYDHDKFWTTTEIRHHIMSMSERKADFKGNDRLGKALRKLGFERVIKRVGTDMQPRHGYYVKCVEVDGQPATWLQTPVPF